MNIAKGYLSNSVVISDNHKYISDNLNGKRLTGHILALQLSEIFSITKEAAKYLIIEWLTEKNLSGDEIIDMFHEIELFFSLNDTSVKLNIEKFEIEQGCNYEEVNIPFGLGIERVYGIRKSPRISLTILIELNDSESIQTIVNVVYVANKFNSTLFDNIKNVSHCLMGCLVTEFTRTEKEIELEIVCDMYQPIMA